MSISTYAVIRNNQRHSERNRQMAFNNRHSHSESSVTDKQSEIVTDEVALALVGSFVDYMNEHSYEVNGKGSVNYDLSKTWMACNKTDKGLEVSIPWHIEREKSSCNYNINVCLDSANAIELVSRMERAIMADNRQYVKLTDSEKQSFCDVLYDYEKTLDLQESTEVSGDANYRNKVADNVHDFIDYMNNQSYMSSDNRLHNYELSDSWSECTANGDKVDVKIPCHIRRLNSDCNYDIRVSVSSADMLELTTAVKDFVASDDSQFVKLTRSERMQFVEHIDAFTESLQADKQDSFRRDMPDALANIESGVSDDGISISD